MKLPIDLVDTLTLFTSGYSGPDIQQVGADPVWEDNSDATYVDLVAKYAGPGNPAQSSTAQANIAPQTFADSRFSTSNPRMVLRIDVRLRAIQGDIPFPVVRLVRSGDGASFLPSSTPAMTSTATETVTLTFPSYGSAFAAPDQHYIETYHNFLPLPYPGSIGSLASRNIYIYEMRPHWYIPVLDAPPCRIFPRGDGLGVGAGRNYPPPKSQQRSSRGVGYY